MAHSPDDRFGDVAQFVDMLRTTESVAAPPSALAIEADVATIASIAVLPFANLGNDRDDEFLSDGITEDLIHALSHFPGLRVAGRTSAFTFKGRTVDTRAAGNALGVNAVLDGSLRRRGDRLRIVVHLTDVKSGFELWSDRFDRQFTDMFDVQDEITRLIVDTLRVRMASTSSARLVSIPTANMDAYEAYLRGRAAWNLRSIRSMHDAIAYLERAITLDPRFALAHAAIADCHVTLAVYGADAPSHAMPAAERAIGRAQSLELYLPEALTSRASVTALYHWDWLAAERDFLGAMQAGASQSTSRQWYAMHLLVPQRRFAEALRYVEEARQLDPLSPVLDASVGVVHFYARDLAKAHATFEQLHAAHPDLGLARYFLGQVLTALGNYSEAVDVLESALERWPHQSEIRAALAVAIAAAGRPSPARTHLAQLGQDATERYVSPVLRAYVHAALGEDDAAIALLDEGFAERATEMVLLPVRPELDNLRPLAGFQDVLRRIALA
jgi:serine/threonine-protein kinase